MRQNNSFRYEQILLSTCRSPFEKVPCQGKQTGCHESCITSRNRRMKRKAAPIRLLKVHGLRILMKSKIFRALLIIFVHQYTMSVHYHL